MSSTEDNFSVIAVLLRKEYSGFLLPGANLENEILQDLKNGMYKCLNSFIIVPGKKGTLAAEEVFDLTNNPDREEERKKRYGSDRSVSVGDILFVDNDFYLCGSIGWIKIDVEDFSSIDSSIEV